MLVTQKQKMSHPAHDKLTQLITITWNHPLTRQLITFLLSYVDNSLNVLFAYIMKTTETTGKKKKTTCLTKLVKPMNKLDVHTQPHTHT